MIVVWLAAVLAIGPIDQSSVSLDQDLSAAAKLWRQMGMPVPDRDSQPVWMWLGAPGPDQPGENHPKYLGFALSAKAGSPPKVIIGDRVLALSDHIDGDWSLATAGKPVYDGSEGDDTITLCEAVESMAAGHADFARALAKHVRWGWDSSDSWWGWPKAKTFRSYSAGYIATHYVSLLAEPDTDRGAILPILKKLDRTGLLASRSPRGLHEVVSGLEATLNSSGAVPGSNDAAIGDLVNSCGYSSSDLFFRQLDDRYKRLANLGLKAVQDLIRHFEDQRLTRIGYGIGELLSVGQVCRNLVSDIAAGDLGTNWYPLTAPFASDWYHSKLAGTVDRFLLDNVIEDRKAYDGRLVREASYRVFEAMAANYPRLLKEAYRRILASRPHVSTQIGATSIGRARMDPSQKIDALMLGALSEDLRDRFWALESLYRYDRSLFEGVLIESLDALNWKISAREYQEDSLLACLVAGTNRDPIWAALNRAAIRVSPDLRTELFSSIRASHDMFEYGRVDKARCLAFLAEYFADQSATRPVRDSKGKATRVVWQSAVEEAAKILEIKTDLGSTSPASAWIALRDQVRAKLSARQSSNPAVHKSSNL